MTTNGANPADIAIIGLACTYPGARNPSEFWQNIVNKVDAVTEVTPDRWDPNIFYSPDPAADGRVYCKKGGWIPGTYAFNPLKYGIMPSALEGTEADHFLVLRTAYEALEDAGYIKKKVDGQRVAIMLGKGNYTGPGVTALMYRSIVAEQVLAILKGLHPEFTSDDIERFRTAIRATLPPLTPEGAAGLIPNICTGRVANRLDFMGRNFTVDAACASSLIATELGMQDLRSGRADLVLAGGVHIFAQIPFLLVFNTMRALSFSSTIRPYDEACDGTIAGEGVGILVLKRLEDAERDGDRIYAVIKGIGSSSDGKAKGIVAPRAEGEELALCRAFEMSGIDPHTVELIEGHGTATEVGDGAEIEALRNVFGSNGKEWPTCAVGSVKSMIGHAMPAAGAAGLIKAALALHHRVLPPTLNCRRPRTELVQNGSPFYVNTESRPWIHRRGEARRAGVSAFGFGGINAHILMEEYTPAPDAPALYREWDSEFVVVEGDSTGDLVAAAARLRQYASRVQGVALRDIAFSCNTTLTGKPERLSVVATSLPDLCGKLEQAEKRLSNPGTLRDRQGIYSFRDPGLTQGKTAILFPGEGSQYLNMLSELCIHFPEVRAAFDLADAATKDPNRRPPSALIFPPPAFSDEEAKAAEDRLWTIDRATEAVLTTDAAVFRLLESLGLKADMMAGHSAGEWIALAAAGVLDTDEFIASMDRLAGMHESVVENTDIPTMSMLAIGAGRDRVERLIAEIDREVWVANDNCAHQVVVVVRPEDEREIVAQLQKNEVFVERLPYDRGYHTPAFTYICEPLRQYFSSMAIRAPRTPLYSCSTVGLYPSDPEEILSIVENTFAHPLLFRQTIEAMYEAGARIFVEAGPRGNLTAFVDDVLRGKPHLAVSVDQFRRPGLSTLNHALAMLSAAHVSLDPATLYKRREPRLLSFDVKADSVPHENDQPGTVQVSICYPRLGVPPPLEPRPAARAAAATHTNGHADLMDVAAWQQMEDPVSLASNGHAFHAPANAAVMEEHLAVMEEFLRTHEDVMLAALGTSGAAEYVSAAAPAPVPPAPSRQSVPAPAPAPERAVVPAPPAAVAPSAAPVSLSDLLLRIVSDRTGYPIEMLDLKLDMEADLGIDSIKRVEIFADLRETGERLGLSADIDIEEVTKLKTLSQVLGFLEKASGRPRVSSDEAALRGIRESPFIRSSTIVDHASEKSIRLRCEIDTEEHLYLDDHCLYFEASERGNQASPLLSMPLTGSLEIMAETAAILCPGRRVVGASSVQVLKWINVKKDARRVVLSVSATRTDESHVKVTISPENAAASERKAPEMLAEATIILEDRFPAPPQIDELKLVNPRQPVFVAQTMYSEHLMFHGPRFHGIVELKEIGENGLQGELVVLPTDNLFASDRKPVFHIDPFLLDAAGQMVGYWPVEYMSEGYVALPIRISRLTLYRDNLPAGTSVQCLTRIRDVSRRQLKGDFDVIGPDGSLWLRVQGWEDWRFYWERHIHEFWRFSKRANNGVTISIPALDSLGVVCQRIAPMSEMDKTGLWEVLWMHMILNRRELAEYQSMEDLEVRAPWIFKRACAKDAVRAWVRRRHGLEIYPADVDIADSGDTGITAGGHWLEQVLEVPHVSACYAGNTGLGVAGDRELGLAAVTVEDPRGDTEDLRVVCARQAAARLLACDADSFSVAGIDDATGRVDLTGPAAITAHTVQDEHLIVAVAVFGDREWNN